LFVGGELGDSGLCGERGRSSIADFVNRVVLELKVELP